MNKKVIKFIKNNWLYVLFLCFIMSVGYFLGNSFNVNAYHLDTTTGNLVSDNLFDFSSFRVLNYSKGLVNINYDTEVIIMNDTTGTGDQYLVFLQNLQLKPNTEYTYSVYVPNQTHYQLYVNIDGVYYNSDTTYLTFTTGNSGIVSQFRIDNETTTQEVFYQFMLNEGDSALPYEPYGVFYSQNNVDSLLRASLDVTSSTAVWDGYSNSIDVMSYLINRDGLLWFDGVFDYLVDYTGDTYENAEVSISFGQRMPINVNYSFSVNGSVGASITFYQGSTQLYSINVTDGFESQCSSVPDKNLCVINLADKVDSSKYTYFDKVVVWSVRSDYIPVSFGFFSNSYYSGYDKGYSDGLSVGFSNGYVDGNSSGYNRGYDVGYSAGLLHQDTYGPNTLVGLVGAIFSGPVTMMQSIFDFNFLGVNLSQFFFSLISLLIVVWLIIKFL